MMTILETNREFLAPQDGAEKQDREERRSKEWLAAHGAHYMPGIRFISSTIFSPANRCATTSRCATARTP
jgi:hypothetical protein